jgi:hypothetical protein
LCDSLDEQQLYGGTQSALSTTLLLWSSGTDVRATGFVDKQHCEPRLLFVVHLSSEGLGREDASYQAKAVAPPSGSDLTGVRWTGAPGPSSPR